MSVSLEAACRRLDARKVRGEPLLDGLPFVFKGAKALGIDAVVSDNFISRKFCMKARVARGDFKHGIKPLVGRGTVFGPVDVDNGGKSRLERLDFVPVALAKMQDGGHRSLEQAHARLDALLLTHRLPFRWRSGAKHITGFAR